MNKFLKLVEESTPGISYIIDIKDSDHNLLGSAAIPDPTNTSFYEEFASYLKKVHKAEVVGVNTRRPVEDQEEELSDEDLAVIKAASDGNQEAIEAVERRKKKREHTTNLAIRTYDGATSTLRQ